MKKFYGFGKSFKLWVRGILRKKICVNSAVVIILNCFKDNRLQLFYYT